MSRQLLLDILPYLALAALGILLLRCLVAWSGGKLQLAAVKRLHRDERGAVQSLAFVLTLPLFIMVLMFIVQLSQITIGRIVVEYASFAAVRAAMVWIPANFGPGEEMENQIASLQLAEEETDENGTRWVVYNVAPSGKKFERIHLAAALACLPICPSHDYSTDRNHPSNQGLASLQSAYASYAPATQNNARIPARLSNKLAYALAYTRVSIQIRHKDDGIEPPLELYEEFWQIDGQYPFEFADNEIGWQDQITVKVEHDFALLPGPGRLLARSTDAPMGTDPRSGNGWGTDSVARHVQLHDNVYTYELTATARLNNEGEKSVLRFTQSDDGGPAGDYDYPSQDSADSDGEEGDSQPAPDPEPDDTADQGQQGGSP